MRKLAVLLLPLVFAAACADSARPPSGPDSARLAPSADPVILQPGADYVPQRLLVKFRPGADGAAIAAANGASIEAEIALGITMVMVPPGLEEHLARVLAMNPNVEFAEPDYYRTTGVPCATGTCEPPNDTFWGYKWDLHNDGTIRNSSGNPLSPTGMVDADMDWLEAYEMLGDFQGGAVIGILDTGIRSTHQEFVGRILAQYDFVRNRPDARDRDGHGTHVAGIAGARGANGVGVPGVAYGPNIRFVIGRVCDIFCPTSAIVNAITWAVDNGADVINLSLGGPSGSSSEQQALQYARANDVLPFCAAGNSGVPSVDYPARFPECVAVSATDWSDGLASYSSWGTQVELSAPGGDDENNNGYSYILSAYNSSDASYAFIAGTSMATPQATGLAALLHALGVTDDDAKLQIMKDTSDDLGVPGADPLFGAGRLNVYAAVTGGGDPPPPPPPPPGDVTLQVTTRFSGNAYWADLAWSGLDGAQVDIHRSGRLRTTTANDGAHSDKVGRRLPNRDVIYQVCQAGSTTVCSDEVTAVF